MFLEHYKSYTYNLLSNKIQRSTIKYSLKVLSTYKRRPNINVIEGKAFITCNESLFIVSDNISRIKIFLKIYKKKKILLKGREFSLNKIDGILLVALINLFH